MNNSKFSLVLRMCRENAGVTQKQVAEALNMERSTYAYYETGASRPSGAMIVKLAAIFNIDYRIFMDALGDTEFDENPEDESFTTLREDSGERREKLYTLEKKEQSIVMAYRSFSKSQKARVEDLVTAIQKENLEAEKKAKRRK